MKKFNKCRNCYNVCIMNEEFCCDSCKDIYLSEIKEFEISDDLGYIE